jgi:Ca2+-binding EF-hand superfamily protein
MVKLSGDLRGKGTKSLVYKIGQEMSEYTPPWEAIQPQAKEYLELTSSLAKYDPPRGTKESWTKLTEDYIEKAAALDKAAKDRNKQAALAAYQALSTTCQGCHQQHRGGRGPGPGGYGPMGSGGFDMGTSLAKPLLTALDTDKDGTVSKEEAVAGAKKFFKLCDKEGKGSLKQEDISAGLKSILPSPQGPSGGPPSGPPGGRPGFDPISFLSGGIIKYADTTNDGKVTQDEMVAAAEKLFAEVDKDKKGKLDSAGLTAAIGKLSPVPFGRPGYGPQGGKIPPQPVRPGGQ